MLPAIVSILVGNFLIGLLFKPALERLRTIREELLSVVVAPDDVHTRSFGSRPWNAVQLRENDEAAGRAINEILRRYTLAHGPFKQIGWLFLAALVVLVNFTVVTAAFSPKKTLILCALLTAMILWLARILAPEAYPSPTQLWDLDYLVGHHSNIHPESLITATEHRCGEDRLGRPVAARPLVRRPLDWI